MSSDWSPIIGQRPPVTFYQVPSYDVSYEVLTRMDPEPFAALLSG